MRRNLIALAIQYAAIKHAGQYDKAGKPYILHPIRVMTSLDTDDQELMAIAVLHDVMEDCGVVAHDLSINGMSDRVIAGVISLTRATAQSETYGEFISRCALNPDARIVKIHDIKDNINILRLKHLGDDDCERLKKYLNAYRFLKDSHKLEI